MADEQALATIEGKASKIKNAIEELALAGGSSDPFHSDVYLNIRDDVVNGVVGSSGNVVLAYCTFTSYFDDIEVEGDLESVEAILNVSEFLSYFGFTTDTGTVRLTFRGHPDDRLATAVEVTGLLNARIMLPSSESVLDEVPLGLPDDFNEENRYEPADGKTPPVIINTDTDQVQRIVEIVEYEDELDYYPITVEEGEFALNAANEDAPGRNSVWGSLNAKSVEAPEDFTNHYHEGFKEVFKTLSGGVELQTAPSDKPMVVVQEPNGRVIRHMLGPVGG